MFKKKDIDLLLELVVNSRQSKRQLSKKVMYTKETVASKIKGFEESGIIKNYSLKVDYSHFNLKEYNVFVKFQNFSENYLENFFDFLISHNQTTWIGKCFGSYDCKISFLAKDDVVANLFIKELYESFSKIISKLDLLIILDKYKSPNKYFISTLFDREVDLVRKKKSLIKSKTDISDTDKEIIYSLGQNPNASYVEIANKLNMSAENLTYNIKKLEKNDVLNGFSAVIDGNKLDKIWGIGMFMINPNEVSAIKEKIKGNPYVSSLTESFGVWNITVTFFASSLTSLSGEYNKFKTEFGKDILNSEFVFILDFYKFPKVPKCILE